MTTAPPDPGIADALPTAVVVALVRRGGRLLLVDGRPPEGAVALGEPLAAAARRVAAAAGVTAEPGAPLPARDRIVRAGDGTLLRHEVLFPVPCAWGAGEGRGVWAPAGEAGA
jgi:hypothetical protein